MPLSIKYSMIVSGFNVPPTTPRPRESLTPKEIQQ